MIGVQSCSHKATDAIYERWGKQNSPESQLLPLLALPTQRTAGRFAYQCQSPTDAKIPPSLPSSPTQLQYDISLHGQSLARRYTLLYTCGKLANLSLTENNETALKLGLCPFRGLEGRESYCQPRVLEGGRYLKTPTGRLPNLGPTEGEKQL